MKRYLILLPALFLLLACNTTKTSKNDTNEGLEELTAMQQKAIPERNKQLLKMGIGFIGYGSNPSWSLAVNKFDKTLLFQLNGKEAQTFSLESMDYVDVMNLQTENSNVDIHIKCIEKVCINNESGEVFPLQIEVTYGGESYSGCGKNIKNEDDSFKVVPYQLHNIWALDAIGGNPIDFSNESLRQPVMEIHLQEMKIMGTTGCNNYQGALYIDGELMHFGPMAMTRKFCEGSLEMKFTEAMVKVARYKIKGEHLILFDKEGNVILEFKKAE